MSVNPDPVRECEVYKTVNCSHVDGYLCRMNTCDILKEYRENSKSAEDPAEKKFENRDWAPENKFLKKRV